MAVRYVTLDRLGCELTLKRPTWSKNDLVAKRPPWFQNDLVDF